MAILLLRRCRRQSRQLLHLINCSQQEFGQFYTLVRNLKDYPDHFPQLFFHIDVAKFQHLQKLVEEDISKMDIDYHHCIRNEKT